MACVTSYVDEFNIDGLRTREEIEDKIAELRLKPMYGYDGRDRIEDAIRTLQDRLNNLDE